MSLRVLADGRIKLSVLTTKPANIAAPTVTELNAGIDFSCKVLQENFNFGAADSDKIAEKALCDVGNANSLGASNFVAGFTVWRYFDEAGGFDATDDAAFEAVKEKGTTLWIYGRQMDKLATAAWAATDEIFQGLGGRHRHPAAVRGWRVHQVPDPVRDAARVPVHRGRGRRLVLEHVDRRSLFHGGDRRFLCVPRGTLNPWRL